MKRICTYLYSYIIAAAALVACDDSGKYITEPTLDKVQFGVTAEVPDSRTALTQGEDGIYRAIWKSGDNIRIAQIADSSAVEYSDHILTEDAEKVEIIASFSQSSASQFTYVLASPSVVVNEDFSTLSLTLPAEQTPSALETFDGNADILISDALNLEAQPTGQSIDFAVNRLSAVGKMTITNLALTDGDKVTSVTFTASQPLAGTIKNIYTSNLVAGKLQTTDFTFTDSSNSVKVNLPQAQSGSFTYFMCCLPTTLSTGEQYTVTVRTEQGRYTKSATIPTPLEFIEGQITSCTINMSGIALDTTPEDETTTYNIGDLVTINGTKGVVFQTTPNIKIVSAEEASLQWGSASVLGVQTGAISTTDGAYNMSIIKAISDYENNYPAFKWCADLGEDWYLPSYDELFVMDNDLSVVNKTLTDNGFSALASQESVYWSSSEYVDSSNNYAHNVNLSTGVMNIGAKNTTARVRAVLVIGDNPATNQILYTSTDGNVVTPNKTDVFGVNITSNTYENGQGVITFDGNVTKVGNYAFENCSTLSSVTLPQTITSLGSYAFYRCTAMTKINIPNSVTSIGNYAFYSCEGLTSVTIPDSVTKIGNFAFYYCSNITCVTIGNGVTSMGYSVFSYCTKLSEFNGKFATSDKRCLVVDGVLKAFAPADLTSYDITDGVTRIDNYTFSDCHNLTSISIPNSVTSIGNHAFAWCSGQKTISLPNSITTIEDSAFWSNRALTEITIPDSVTQFGASILGACESLTAINSKYSTADHRAMIVDGKLIAFAPYGLTSYTIPDSVTSIGKNAFSYCHDLASVTISNSVTAIGNSAFSYCTALTKITIPQSVTSIGNNAFYYCTSLAKVICKPTTPPALDVYAFQYYNNGYQNIGCKIYVPAESVSAYKSAENWSTYANDILADSGTIDPAKCKILYTSTDGKVVTPYSTTGFGANIVSNTYSNGQGVITFDDEVLAIGNDAFRECTTLSSIEIPEGVEEIGYQAFEVCSSLESITIPTTLKSFGSVAFNACEQLKSVHISDLTAWCKITPTSGDCNPLSYGADLYLNGSKVTNLTIPSDITTINNMAFYGCGSLMSVTIPNHVTNISWSAFCGCQNIAQLTIEEGVTTIESHAFAKCSKLKSVTIPDSVWRLGEAVFSRCNSLTEINCRYSTADKRCLLWNSTLNSFAPADLTSYVIPDGVTSIGSEAFYGCSNLTSISIPEGVTSIGHSAFFNCDALTNVTLPQSVTYIYMAAFYSCNKLESVTIGANVGTIEDYAFNSCNKLTTVYCNATTPPTLGGTYVFDGNASGRKIYVPSSAVSAYKSAQYWSEYADAIEANGSATTYQIGDLVTINGVQGIVFQTSPVKIVSVVESELLKWGEYGVVTDATNSSSGLKNMNTIKNISNWTSQYLVFKWCASLGSNWYLPAYKELLTIYDQLTTLNKTISANELVTFKSTYYWSSTENSNNNAYVVDFSYGNTGFSYKYNTYRVRAVYAM